MEIYINSQKKKEFHIKQYNYYEKKNNTFTFSIKEPDFNIQVNKDTCGNNIGIYEVNDIIFNIFLKYPYYNLYILKNNNIFNEYQHIYRDSIDNNLKNLIYNYLLLIINNKI